MFTFRQYLIEMAKPRDVDQGKLYYHGTNGPEKIRKILRSGVIKGADSQGRSHLAPVAGKTYITPHISYAQIYAMGGDVAGSAGWVPKDRNGKKISHGYVLGIEGKHLKDIQPDEDDVGEKLYNQLRGIHHPNTGQKIAGPHPWLEHLARAYLSPQKIEKVKTGEYAHWASAGKTLLPRLSDNQKLELIDHGAHIAHHGPLVISHVWKIHLSKIPLLKKDGSNFFEHAHKIR